MSATKRSRSTPTSFKLLFFKKQINFGASETSFKLLFFKKQIHFGASEQMPIYGKLNLLPIKCIYLVFSSRERQRKLMQNKVYYKLFYSVWKEVSHKPLKVAAVKKSSPSMYITGKNCSNLCFLFHVITRRRYFLRKFSTTQRFGVFAMLLRALTQVFWNRSGFNVRYLLHPK